MARAHRLNTSIVLAAVHGLSGSFSGGFRGRAFTDADFIVQELCEIRGGRPGLSVLTSLLVSVDVKIY